MSWNILSIKKYLFIALAIGGLSLATSSIADARPHGPKIGKMLFKDLELSADQKAELKEMRSERKAFKKEFKKGKGDRKDWMLELINGDTSVRSIHTKIDQTFDERSEFHVQKITSMLDFVEGLDRDQRAQLLDNIEKVQDRKEERRAKRKEKRAERMKNKERGSFAKKLFEDISLNRNQSTLLSKIESKQKEMRSERKERGSKGHLSVMEDFASGSKSRSSILRAHKSKTADKREHKHQMVDLWSNLISTMDEEQKDQLVHNIETLQEKRKERMQKRKDRMQKRKDRSQRGDFEREEEMERDFSRDDF